MSMTTQEIVAAVIDSNQVTNDPGRVEAALLCGHPVEYVGRARAKELALRKEHEEWSVVAKAPVMYVVIDGIRHRRDRAELRIDFAMRECAE